MLKILGGILIVLSIINLASYSGGGSSEDDIVREVRKRFVYVTSDCEHNGLGSGTLMGMTTKQGEQVVVTAYHLLCNPNNLRVEQKPVKIIASIPDSDILVLAVAIKSSLKPIKMRAETRLNEQVFAIGTNHSGDRATVLWGRVLIAPPGQVTAKIPTVPGNSGGPLVSAEDGAMLGMVLREGFSFANCASITVIMQALTQAGVLSNDNNK